MIIVNMGLLLLESTYEERQIVRIAENNCA
jgi:hypothetical protein